MFCPNWFLKDPASPIMERKKKGEKLANTAFTMLLSIGAGSPWAILKRVQILLNQGL
jgi:hypothetical protein